MRQKFADEPLTTHEGCGGTVERLLSAPALQFKGSGWYVTDYGRNGSAGSNGKPESKTDKSDKSESKTDKAESKSDSKPASTAPTTGT